VFRTNRAGGGLASHRGQAAISATFGPVLGEAVHGPDERLGGEIGDRLRIAAPAAK
jgi:hypothetical protein